MISFKNYYLQQIKDVSIIDGNMPNYARSYANLQGVNYEDVENTVRIKFYKTY